MNSSFALSDRIRDSFKVKLYPEGGRPANLMFFDIQAFVSGFLPWLHSISFLEIIGMMA